MKISVGYCGKYRDFDLKKHATVVDILVAARGNPEFSFVDIEWPSYVRHGRTAEKLNPGESLREQGVADGDELTIFHVPKDDSLGAPRRMKISDGRPVTIIPSRRKI